MNHDIQSRHPVTFMHPSMSEFEMLRLFSELLQLEGRILFIVDWEWIAGPEVVITSVRKKIENGPQIRLCPDLMLNINDRDHNRLPRIQICFVLGVELCFSSFKCTLVHLENSITIQSHLAHHKTFALPTSILSPASGRSRIQTDNKSTDTENVFSNGNITFCRPYRDTFSPHCPPCNYSRTR